MRAVGYYESQEIDAPTALLDLEVPDPVPGPRDLVVRVRAVAVNPVDTKIRRRRAGREGAPVILGWDAAGEVVAAGTECRLFRPGDRVGVPWLAWTDGDCRYCRSGRENLCDRARFTGYHIDGGYAERTVADERYCFALPPATPDVEAAPLLCAGLIGYRSLRAAGDAERLGIYGFGAAAHLIAQVARHEGRRVFAFTRPGDADGQGFARELGAEWAGDSSSRPPEPLDAAIIFAPVGALVPAALAAVVKGGTVVCAGIHMSPIPSFSYDLLWGERVVRSVANLTRRDGEEFFRLLAGVPLRVAAEPLPLERANEGLSRLRSGALKGAAVLTL